MLLQARLSALLPGPSSAQPRQRRFSAEMIAA